MKWNTFQISYNKTPVKLRIKTNHELMALPKQRAKETMTKTYAKTCTTANTKRAT